MKSGVVESATAGWSATKLVPPTRMNTRIALNSITPERM